MISIYDPTCRCGHLKSEHRRAVTRKPCYHLGMIGSYDVKRCYCMNFHEYRHELTLQVANDL